MKRAALARRTRLRRRTPLRARRRSGPGLVAAKAAVRLRSRGVCEAGDLIPVVCTVVARHAHHLKRRSQGGKDTLTNLIDVCPACHTWIHDHPAHAQRLGLLHTAATIRQALGDDPR